MGEKQSVAIAKQRLEVDFDGEVEDLSKMTSYTAAEDVDTAMGILGTYGTNAKKLAITHSLKSGLKIFTKKYISLPLPCKLWISTAEHQRARLLKLLRTVSQAEKKMTKRKVLKKTVLNNRGRAVEKDTSDANESVKQSAKEAAKTVLLEDFKDGN